MAIFFCARHPDECELFFCDLDGNGAVDGADFSIFLAAFGHGTGDAAFNPDADLDGDGVVTFVDFQIWLACFRHFTGSPLANPPIPADVGDMNADGLVDGRDIQGFVNTIIVPSSADFRTHFVADITGDGLLDNADVSGFVGLLLPEAGS